VTAVLLALGAGLAWGVADFWGGVTARRVPVPIVVVVTQIAGLVLVGVIVVAAGEPPPEWKRIAYGALAGGVGVVGLTAFYRGLAVGSMGVVAPIAATAALVPVGVGLARGERPSGLQAVGVALALAGVAAASLEPERRALHDRRVAAGVGLALVAAVCFGSALVGLQAAAKGGPVWATVSMRGVAVPLAVVGVLVLRTPVRGSLPRWPSLVLVGLGDTGANLLFGAAANRGLLSVVSVLASLYPVIVVVLARLVLSERLGRAQLTGAAAALLGVALISAG